MEDAISERFREGIGLFNEHSFYKCHDVLQDVWFDVRGSSRRFYQGLIHLAVGFYHILERENPKGAVSQLSKGVEKLSDYKPQFQGVELEILLRKIEICVEEVKSPGKNNIGDFDTALIPKINFNPEKFVEP
jgi:predicted metal-dependent hydrolase